ncbi:MAG TPA: redoxin family protein [Gemmatales bacterium]|nr:redoxin family protein [Gemmatales bacterium]
MKRLIWLAIACLMFSIGSVRAAETLSVGDAAPKLEVNEFVKGEVVKEFKPGQIYVVEFWATWCGPCRATIPHLSKLQKQYGDKVTFIGVSVWERDASKVVPFVKEMGEKMEYRVATDKVGKDEDPSDGPMAKNWMTAAEQDGIPASFIVNGEGKIAWIGHPAQIDTALEEVVAGTYDMNKAVAKAKKDKAAKAKFEQLKVDLRKVSKEGPSAVLKVIDAAIKDTPDLEEQVGIVKFNVMAADKDTNQDDLLKYGERLVNETYKDDGMKLNEIAWAFVDPARSTKANKAQIALALKAAQRGVDVSKGKDHGVIDTLACAHFANGDNAKAIECIEKALKMAPDEQEYKDRLDMFKKAGK